MLSVSNDLLALLQIPNVPDTPDEVEIARYLIDNNFANFDWRKTLYTDVFKVPPAHYLMVGIDKVEIHQYWHPENVSKINYQSTDYYVEHLLELLNTVIEPRVSGTSQIGSHLSGGLDSSVITGLAQKYSKSLLAFSWSPDVIQVNSEVHRIKMLEDYYGLNVIFNAASETQPYTLSEIDISVYPIDTVDIEKSILLHAQKENIRVMLSGWGGDQTVSFGGRGEFVRQFLRCNWLQLIRNLNGEGKPFDRYGLFRRIPRQFYQKVIKVLFEKLHVPSVTPFTYFLTDSLYSENNSWIDKPFKSKNVTPIGGHANQLMMFYSGSMTRRLESWAWFGAKFGVTYSYPFLDKRLLEFAYGLPSDLYLKDGWKRYIFRKASDQILPNKWAWNAQGHPKHDDVLFAYADNTNSDISAYVRSANERIERCSQNPWVNTGQIKTYINRIEAASEVLSPRHHVAAACALNILLMWENWMGRIAST